VRTGAEVELDDSIRGPDDTSEKPDPRGSAHRCDVGRGKHVFAEQFLVFSTAVAKSEDVPEAPRTMSQG
jgi:hypothetical protein